MNPKSADFSSARSIHPAFWSARAGEIAVAAFAWFGMQELAHLRLTPVWWIGVLAGWVVIWSLATWARAMRPAWRGVWAAAEAAGPWAMLVAMNRHWAHPLTTGQLLYASVLLWTVVRSWRAWVQWRVGRAAEPIVEPWRVLLVGTAPLLVLLPFFSNRLIGGTDARWYAFMLRDFIDQLRGGIFPVFIGQGEFAWNGAVHPFRSAPIYMWVAAVWDVLTGRSLNVLALQHLTVLTAGVAGALGFYAAAAALLPTRRWVAAGFAVLYAVAPAWLGVLYWTEAIMTFMALGALPAVLYGNARALLSEDGRGYGWLAVGLALVWMCHPPTALVSTLASVLLQGGTFMLGRAPKARWRGALVGAGLAAGLAAYYFVGMSELPKASGEGRQDVLQILGLLLALAGWGNGLLLGRSRWWLVLLPIGGWFAWLGMTPWLAWLVAATVLVVGIAAMMRWRRVEPRDYAVVLLFGALVVGAGLTQAWVGPGHPERNEATLGLLKANERHGMQLFLPMAADLSGEGRLQPGTGLWIMFLVLAVGFVPRGPLAVKLFFVAACVPMFGLVRVPWVSDFLVGFAPKRIAEIINLPLGIRLLPLITGLVAMGGVLWFATVDDAARRWRRRCGLALLGAAVVGSLVQATPFLRRGWAATDTRTRSEDKFLPENALLERFSYDLMRIPVYFSHGWMDPWMQARLLDSAQEVLIGPDETARVLETAGGSKRQRLSARTANNSTWVLLKPDLVVAPGERMLLRFEFAEQANYAGWFIWTSEHGYREYHLPVSGWERGFGSAGRTTRVITIRNSTEQTAHYEFSMLREAGNTVRGDGDFFADVIISHYNPGLMPVRVNSLIPYRVTATASAPGWIETGRVWIPGYRAKLDGQAVEVIASKEGAAMVAITPGRHELELLYVGTGKLWAALTVSVLTWLGWLVWVVRRVWAGASAG